MQYHYVYQITNLINNKIYVGKRTSSVPPENDSYMGSGKAIKSAITKYGEDNFFKEVLSIHNTSESAFIEESLIVNEDFINRHDTYNMMTGGNGGKQSADVCKRISETLRGRYKGEQSPNFGRKHSDESRKKNSDSHKEYYLDHDGGFKGKHHTDETKQVLKDKHTGLTKHSDEFKQLLSDRMKANNPMSDGMSEESKKKLSETKKKMFWVNNGIDTKMVNEETFITLEPSWVRGRGRIKK